jgi:hypothetical protein
MKNNTNEFKISKAKQRLLFLLCLTPLISFAIMKPEWVARLVAVAGCTAMLNALIFWYGFNPKTDFISRWSKWARQTESTQQFGQTLLRVLTILMGCFFIWFLTVPIAIDCIRIARNGENSLIHLQGQVTSDDLIFGTFFFRQSITISENGQPTQVPYQVLFYPRYLGRNTQLYQFLITPKTEIVLECDVVTNNQNHF